MNIAKADEFYRKALIGLFIIGVIIMIVTGIRQRSRGITEDLEYHFNGVVDSVSYDIKGTATVIIKGAHFYLGNLNWDFDHNRIRKGDSLMKKRNSMIIRLKGRMGRLC